ncbi:DgyrCDS6590 [Dimorphilus gyrociliatus]|uniref:DgyrCDS6590 n=1 Tax=Dimorphilus gyrociliatus TaxID=2664684 RepID=A0A7I8VTA4_9ANNE|nr:DgyrCDS6590 [Dimorphilus gyrociliatus]
MAVLLVEVFSFVLLLCSTISDASTHWIVTEGGKLQAQVDSVFNLHRPYDLLALLRQEGRAYLLQNLQDELVKKKKDIDQNDKDEPGLEERYYKEDSDCIIAGKPLTEYDLYISTVLPLQNKNINGEDFLEPSTLNNIPPDCISAYDLPFSMHSFDHLHGVRLRKNLTAAAELGLINAVCPDENVNDYGSRISDALKRNNTSWVLYNMAAFYWRIKGNAFNVVECLRRALHFSPRQHKDVALISLANILHRAKRSKEAAVLLHAAIDINSDLNVNHFTLGNIYAVLGDYNKSVICFENTLIMQKDFEAAYRRKHAVKCHHKIETALEAQHKTLQKTLNELRSYQKRHELFEKERFVLNTEKALDSEKEIQQQSYENSKLAKKMLEQEELCNDNACEWHPKKLSKLSFNNVKKFRDVFPNWPPYTEVWDGDEVNNFGSKTPREYLNPVKESRYVKREEYTKEELSRFVYKQKNWPDKQECDTYVQKIPAWNDFPTTYLPPENKGFDVRTILSAGLGLTDGVGHDLPWYPPVCVNLDNIPEGTQSYDHLEAIKKRTEVPLKLYDSYMRPLLQSLVPDATEEEIGQRILTALKSQVGPAWLLYNVAGLYWRVIGNNYHSIECLRRSLYLVPTKYRDVPLVNLANILYKWGRVDEAIILIREASSINSMEPETHFMLANLLAAKGNTSGAIYHYEECLHQQPDHQQALTMLRALNCYIKFHRAAQSSAPVATMIMKKAVENAPTIFCRKDSEGFENCVFEATGNCYKPDTEKLKILCEGNDCNEIISGKRRPHIKLELSSGIIHRKLFIGEGNLQISPNDCVIFNDGSKSEGCNLDHFKYYVSIKIYYLSPKLFLSS